MVGRPPKLSEGAERLTGVVGHAQVLSGGFDPSYKPHAREVKRIVAVIVTELGITPEMVGILRSTFDVSPHRAYANDRGLMAADARETLLEVAGQ